ncbi:hypothetical protein E3T33_03785 [Cryobacterium sp. TMT1-2-1]|uniref:hypothetical protein n=1 Tax=Cryobacterium sp. TMT1-2-1 TaxID=1259232 RepID=UPI00106CD246|nr:hypothetical protein [Cryobacterium sp. TMT1-2-1]TFD47156.1 hypothetical protein E3T33_03785 [Cryobacterium sp. TMT1-2-1]
MSEITGAAIGALAVICIPLIAWFSRRATPEGRLTLRVERLGNVYALMPESQEKETFRQHLTGAISNLNTWLDPDARKRRRVIQGAAVSVYLVGVVLAMWVINSVDENVKPWVSPILGAALGVAISGVAIVMALLLERSARRKAGKSTKAAEEAATALRIEALKMGVPVRGQSIDVGQRA